MSDYPLRTAEQLSVLPQAFRMTIPPLINVYIALTKNTSVAGGFFVVELAAGLWSGSLALISDANRRDSAGRG